MCICCKTYNAHNCPQNILTSNYKQESVHSIYRILHLRNRVDRRVLKIFNEEFLLSLFIKMCQNYATYKVRKLKTSHFLTRLAVFSSISKGAIACWLTIIIGTSSIVFTIVKVANFYVIKILRFELSLNTLQYILPF